MDNAWSISYIQPLVKELYMHLKFVAFWFKHVQQGAPRIVFYFIIFFPKLPFLVSTGRLLTPIRENTQPFWNTLCRDEKKSKSLLFVTVVCIMSMLRLLFWCSTISIWVTISLCCQLVWELRGHGDWKDRYR